MGLRRLAQGAHGRARSIKTPTQRTLEYLRKNGWTCAVTERWNSFAKIRQDLFGGIDVVAVKENEPGVLGVQCTTLHNMSARERKCLDSKALHTWVKAGNKLWVMGWYQSTEDRKWLETYRILSLTDFQEHYQRNQENNTNDESESPAAPTPAELTPEG